MILGFCIKTVFHNFKQTKSEVFTWNKLTPYTELHFRTILHGFGTCVKMNNRSTSHPDYRNMLLRGLETSFIGTWRRISM
jgi:hypothetical protein